MNVFSMRHGPGDPLMAWKHIASRWQVHDCGGIRKNSATRQTRPPHRNSAKERYVIIAFVICAAYTSTEGDCRIVQQDFGVLGP